MLPLFHRTMLLLALSAMCFGQPSAAQASVVELCPGLGVQTRTRDFPAEGIILTAFDRNALWVYELSSGRRYPLPDTNPCASNCQLSPDARWISYVNPITRGYFKMRLNGSQRTLLVEYASDVEWWSADTLLVWTPGHEAYLRPEGADLRQPLRVSGAVAVQPGGRWALVIYPQGDGFQRRLEDLGGRAFSATGKTIQLGADTPYFNAAAWSPDGSQLAFVGQVNGGAELFAIRPTDAAPVQLTDLTEMYGAVRINGRSESELSWSPDGARIAFWVMAQTGPVPAAGDAVLHIHDLDSGETRAYCDFATSNHTPNPPSLTWAPDGAYVAFGAAIPGDTRGTALLALDVTSGQYTELSMGLYPVFGAANVVAWGYGPP